MKGILLKGASFRINLEAFGTIWNGLRATKFRERANGAQLCLVGVKRFVKGCVWVGGCVSWNVRSERADASELSFKRGNIFKRDYSEIQ